MTVNGIRGLLAAALVASATSAQALECANLWSFVGRMCSKSAAAWDHGKNELIVSGYAYHLRSTYTEEKLREFNEKAWGGGWARTVTDPDGDTHTIFLFGFHESHGKLQWNAGYTWSTWWGAQDGLRGGLRVRLHEFGCGDVGADHALDDVAVGRIVGSGH